MKTTEETERVHGREPLIMNMRVRCPKTGKSFVVHRDFLTFSMEDSYRYSTGLLESGEMFVEFECRQCNKSHKIEINQY